MLRVFSPPSFAEDCPQISLPNLFSAVLAHPQPRAVKASRACQPGEWSTRGLTSREPAVMATTRRSGDFWLLWRRTFLALSVCALGARGAADRGAFNAEVQTFTHYRAFKPPFDTFYTLFKYSSQSMFLSNAYLYDCEGLCVANKGGRVFFAGVLAALCVFKFLFPCSIIEVGG